jgi:hypothetical protein
MLSSIEPDPTLTTMKHDSLCRCAALLASILWLCALPAAPASTIDENTAGPSTAPNTAFFGESFITPASSSFDNIAFTFLTSGGANFATGTGFLLSSEYLGTPAALSSSTTGFLGQTNASGNFYTFAGNITLAPSTTYYFYENVAIAGGTIFGGNGYPGHQFYYTEASNSNFGGQGAPLNFRVTGTAVSTAPDSGTSALLLGVGLACLFFVQHALGRRTGRASV